MEQQTSFKGGGDGRDGNGEKFLHLSFTTGATTPLQISPYTSLLMSTAGL